jgi:hypothetical protein
MWVHVVVGVVEKRNVNLSMLDRMMVVRGRCRVGRLRGHWLSLCVHELRLDILQVRVWVGHEMALEAVNAGGLVQVDLSLHRVLQASLPLLAGPRASPLHHYRNRWRLDLRWLDFLLYD